MGQTPQAGQSRKKRVLEEVQRHRRQQRRITLAITVVAMIAIIVGVTYFLTHQSTSNLPAYLNECVTGTNPYHAHVHLSIVLNNVNQTIPALLGINGGCLHPLHTHSTDGVIHVEPDTNRTFTISDFFLIWNQPFNSTQVLTQHFTQGQVQMTVNGVSHPELGGYVIPQNAKAVGNDCSASPACQFVDVVIKAPAS